MAAVMPAAGSGRVGRSRRLCILLCLMVLPCTADAVEMNGRAQVSGEFDNNIREDPDRSQYDQAVRFFSSLRLQGGDPGNVFFQIAGNGGYRGYKSFSQENRINGNSRFTIGKKWENGFGLEGGGGILLEDYWREDRDNLTSMAQVRITLPHSYSAFNEMAVTYHFLENDYQASADFDVIEQSLVLEGFQPITQRLNLIMAVTVGMRFFKRHVVNRYLDATGSPLRLDEKQEDIFTDPEIRLQYYRVALIEGSYRYREYRSNSYGYSFREHRFGAVVGSRFLFGSTVKVLISLEAKQYREKGRNVLFDLDEDREADNQCAIEISRLFAPKSSVELRYEIYRNESRMRDLYYSKSVVSVGLQYRI